MSAPRRLLDDPSVSEALRDDLRVAADAEADYDSRRGLQTLLAAIGTLAPAAPLGDGGAAHAASNAAQSAATATKAGAIAKAGSALSLSSTKLTLVAVATAVGLGAVGASVWMGREPSAQPTPAAPLAPPATAPAPAPAPALTQPPTEPAGDAPLAPVLPAATEPPTTAATDQPSAALPHVNAPARPQHVSPAAGDPDRGLRNEIDHLARVKALLEQDPRAAYRLAQAGNRTLSSMFREERDGLSVLALDAAGDHARARTLAKQFLIRHPSSPLRERIEAVAAEAAETR